ncbi:rhamnan synthesis F family protein [Glaciecola siphonariae]|uniref:Rhamnan synthesis F family protein n=1 Tax=Glaciecola siphonariae TaxID=521012 RepID=A0ABV9LV81_9ALTE
MSKFRRFLKRLKLNDTPSTDDEVMDSTEQAELGDAGSDESERPIPENLVKYKEHFDIAVELGLFDIQWYEAHYGTFESDIAAFADYIEKSNFANINPSAHFDTESYLRRNLDVYHEEAPPLLHYMYFGAQDKRAKSNAQVRWHPKDALVANETENWKEQKVAIVLHIFYQDSVVKFAESIATLPLNVDVFVTAASGEIAELATQTFNSIATVDKVQVKHVPNHGRNFGPFLVEFSEQLLDYDLMCHMHSKKSLYSGREQTQWFDYLHQYLLKDRHTVACLLRLFSEHEDLGMYYPTSFWMMPGWVNHWTCNLPFAQPFIDQWQLDINSDFVNYPVGGMFWARPKALAPLLSKTYAYDDFPGEPLPNDGSYLHALERVLGLLVEKQNYKQFFYYPTAAKFTLDKSYIYINYTKSTEQLFHEVQNFEIVSFDVFDTLVNRQYVAPDFAKYRLGEYLVEQEVVASPELFVKLRNDTETQLRIARDHKGDLGLAEIYESMAKELGCDPEQTSQWCELEFQFDLQIMSGKTEMIQLANRLSDLGREIWLITDTYYSEQQISMILRHCGLAIGFRLFVSSELKVRKDNASMWQYIQSIIKEKEMTIVHIGDNVRSDAQLCGDHGITNVHVLHPKDKWLAAGFKPNALTKGMNDKYESLKWGPLLSKFGRYPFFGN